MRWLSRHEMPFSSWLDSIFPPQALLPESRTVELQLNADPRIFLQLPGALSDAIFEARIMKHESPLRGSSSPPQPDLTEDVVSVDAIITSLYDSISFLPGTQPDYVRLKSLFHPQGRLIPPKADKDPHVQALDVGMTRPCKPKNKLILTAVLCGIIWM